MRELYTVRRRYHESGVDVTDYYVMSDRLGRPVWTPLQARAHLFDKPIAQAYQFFLGKMLPNALVDMVRLEERRKAAGFGLLEMMIAMLIAEVLFAIAIPNAVTLQRYEERQLALSQVRRVVAAEGVLAVCSAQVPPVACPIPALIPQPGTLAAGGYSFTFTLVPGSPGTPMAYSSSSCSWPSGQPGYTFDATANASAGYPICSSVTDGGIGGCRQVVGVNQLGGGSNLLTGCPSAAAVPGTPPTWTYVAAPVNGDAYSYFADQTGLLRYDVTPNVANASSPLE